MTTSLTLPERIGEVLVRSTPDEALRALLAVAEDLVDLRPCDDRSPRLAHHIHTMRGIIK